ncbi:hypothetical protein CKAH01_16638 [Colletotrichum kahawae]|uniref:Uncharacterized protein n=1 Tax=Colletotrichum kahawae TaxID=34407 RepID=A0AAD9YFL6_COLKA|nr:hypothetical protein CKAH01_16638 [Colletotrichum kahawae]
MDRACLCGEGPGASTVRGREEPLRATEGPTWALDGERRVQSRGRGGSGREGDGKVRTADVQVPIQLEKWKVQQTRCREGRRWAGTCQQTGRTGRQTDTDTDSTPRSSSSSSRRRQEAGGRRQHEDWTGLGGTDSTGQAQDSTGQNRQ